MSLDTAFGPLISPQRSVQDWEQRLAPNSLSKLDTSSAHPLREHMEAISSGWKVGRILIFDTSIIWLVDEIGDIWFAIEELVLDGIASGHPRYKTLPAATMLPKLGHPALNNCAKARIAGEIYFDVGREPAIWVIDNQSGRYGRHPTRIEAHLVNVANRFSNYGIKLTTFFRR